MSIISFLHKDLLDCKIYKQLKSVGDCVLLSDKEENNSEWDSIKIENNLFSSKTIQSILRKSENYNTILLLTQNTEASITNELVCEAENSQHLCLYSNYRVNDSEKRKRSTIKKVA